jgi:Cu/Ag efflux protein CusF
VIPKEICMRSLSVLALALAAALPLPSVAQKAEVSGAVGTAPGKAGAIATLRADATVESVDPATRTVGLKLNDGTKRSFVAGDEVRNFDQIKVGDKLKVRYAEAMTLELKKDGKAVVGRTETGSLQRAAPGQKPGGVAEREVTGVGDVVAVDAAAKKVSVKNAKGEIIDLPVQDPEQLKLVKKGDQVQVTYRQALAISLEAPAAAEKKPAEKKK